MSSSKPVSPDLQTPLSPQAQLFSLAAGAFITRAIALTADLAIPDLLAEGPRRTEDLPASRRPIPQR
jgi:hypothetical protein